MKIAFLAIKGMPLGGGIEKYTEEIGSRLVSRGHKVTVYTMRRYGAIDGSYKGMHIKTLPSVNVRSLEKMSAVLFGSIDCVINSDVDIAHYHAIGPSIFSFMPRFKGVKVVVQSHGIEWRRSKWGIGIKTALKLSELSAVNFPDALSVVSKVQQEYYRRRYGAESIYIPPGVSSPNTRKPDLVKKFGLKGGDYILFAARLVREKGAHYLIQAYKKLKTDLSLVIAGDAQHEERYKAELFELAGDCKNIIFPGFVQGELKDEFFSNAYCVVAPSEIEGLSITVLEAMSYGNCCLVSDIPENMEAISSHGYMFRSQDVDDLKGKLDILTKNKHKVHRVKKRAKDYVLKNFSWDAITDRWEDLYTNLCK